MSSPFTSEADLRAGESRRSGTRIRIQRQPFKVPAILLENAGELVTRDQIQQRLWGSDTTVDFDHSLGIAINKLREALSDSADNPRFIETLARRGYRFIAPVLPEIPAAAVSVVMATGPAGPPEQVSLSARDGHWPAWLIGATLFACIAIGFLLVAVRQQPRGSTGRTSRISYSGRILNSKLDLDRVSTVLTDGSRLFFSQVEGGRTLLAEASITNGEVLEMKLPSEIDSPILLAISPDRSSLLVHNTLTSDPEPPLWIVPTLGGKAQRVPNLLAHDTTWMPEGKRIL